MAQKINAAITSMLKEDRKFPAIDWMSERVLNESSEYEIDYESIEDLFRPCSLNELCPMKLSKKTIYNRLAIIDNLYGTNIVRMRSFGIADLSDRIWSICNDGLGYHSDTVLINKAKKFVQTYSTHLCNKKSALTDDITDSFNKDDYGYEPAKAPSIISKYLYFLLQTDLTNNVGFPIYDSLVCKVAPKIAAKLGVQAYGCTKEICRYTFMLSEIIRVLEAQNPALWNQQNPRRTKFALLDHFLWRIGKVKAQSYSLLMSKDEYSEYKQSHILPQHIILIQQIIKTLNI